MHHTSEPADDLARLAETYGVSPGVLNDLVARRRAGALDRELLDLLGQSDRGGLDPATARALVDELPRQ